MSYTYEYCEHGGFGLQRVPSLKEAYEAYVVESRQMGWEIKPYSDWLNGVE